MRLLLRLGHGGGILGWRRVAVNDGLAVDVPPMANVNHEDEQGMMMHDVDDAVAADAIGASAVQGAFETLALGGVASEIIERLDDAPVKLRLHPAHPPQHALGLVGKLHPIDEQGSV